MNIHLIHQMTDTVWYYSEMTCGCANCCDIENRAFISIVFIIYYFFTVLFYSEYVIYENVVK